MTSGVSIIVAVAVAAAVVGSVKAGGGLSERRARVWTNDGSVGAAHLDGSPVSLGPTGSIGQAQGINGATSATYLIPYADALKGDPS